MLERVRLIKSEGRENRKPWKQEKNDIVQTVRGEGESAQRLQKKLRLEFLKNQTGGRVGKYVHQYLNQMELKGKLRKAILELRMLASEGSLRRPNVAGRIAVCMTQLMSSCCYHRILSSLAEIKCG